MIEFTVKYNGFLKPYISKVYCVNADEFLIADREGEFFWVNMSDCRLIRDELDEEDW